MSQTLREYMTEPYNKVIDDTALLDETMPLSEFLQELDRTQKRTNFASPAHYKPLTTKPHGLIIINYTRTKVRGLQNQIITIVTS